MNAMIVTIYIAFATLFYIVKIHGVTSHNPEVKNKKPHIIFIMADDLGWNDVSYHGSDQIPTPNIDALAYNGVILNKYYSQPTCTPSRTSFLTGRYPIRTGMQGFPLKAAEPRGIPLDVTLLPQYLKRLGYITGLIGKWHTGYHTKRHTPAERGFDTFFGYYNGLIEYFKHSYTEVSNGKTGYDLHQDTPHSLDVAYESGYFTDILSERAEHIISNHNPEVPLFLEISHLAPHASTAADILEVRDLKGVNSTFAYIQDYNRRKFAGVMQALDESVGRTVAALKKAKMLENSIIIFASDNGAQTEGLFENYGSNYPLRGLKFSVHEGAVRVAACIYSPLIKKLSRTSNILMHVSDWLPTLYSAAGGNVNDLGEIDGVNQWSVIKDDGETSREFLLVNINEKENTEAAIYKKFKIIKGALNIYDDYYGDTGKDKAYPPYNITKVLTSATNSAINNNSDRQISPEIISKLRIASEVRCKKVPKFADCSRLCLFDLYTDPCETLDVSQKFPRVVQLLESKLDDYRKVLVNQTNAEIDPAGFAENFGGIWMPWISDKA